MMAAKPDLVVGGQEPGQKNRLIITYYEFKCKQFYYKKEDRGNDDCGYLVDVHHFASRKPGGIVECRWESGKRRGGSGEVD